MPARAPQRFFFGPLPFAVHSGRKVNTRPVLTYPNTKSKCNGFYNGFHCSNGCWYMYSQSKSNTLLHDSFVPSTLGPRLHSLNYSIAPAPYCKEYFGRTGVCMYNVCIVKAQVSKISHALASYVLYYCLKIGKQNMQLRAPSFLHCSVEIQHRKSALVKWSKRI